jgi:hypothetical protein
MSLIGFFTLTTLAIRKNCIREEQKVVWEGKTQSVWVDREDCSIILSTGNTAVVHMALVKKDGVVKKELMVPPSLWSPPAVIYRDVTTEESSLYEQIFPATT